MRRLVDRLLEHPLLYAAWQAPFVSSKFAPVERQLEGRAVQRVLDVGCGPGTNAARFTAAEYVGVDINGRYLAIARRRHRGRFVQADLASADIASLGTFDTILVNSFLHHLPDNAVRAVLERLQAVLEPHGCVHVLELVLPERYSISTLMARLDRGRFPRPLPEWKRLFETYFEPAVFEPYMFGGRLWSMIYFQGRLR